MKKLFIFIFLFLSFYFYSQTYTWATTDNTYQNSGGASLALDASGNLSVAEIYSNPGIRSGVNIIKFDVNHNILWKQKIEGSYLYNPNISTDASGNIVFIAGFRDSLIINNIVYKTTCVSCFSMVLIKFNAQGIFQWLKQSTGSDASGFLIDTDTQNNIYIAGNINGNVYFDTTHISTNYNWDYVAKYNPNGVLLWIRTIDGQLCGLGYGFKTDAAGNSYLTSGLYTWAKFGNITINDSWDENIFVAKIDANGNWLWAKRAGGSGQDVPSSLELDINGNPYITGFIGSTTASFGTVTVTNTGQDDYFLAKYDPNGNTVWAICGGGPGSQSGSGVCVDSLGTIYMARTGTYFSKFDNNGVYLNSDFKSSVSNAAMIRGDNSCVYVTGAIVAPTIFGTTNLIPSQPQQMYIVKYCNSGTASVKELEFSNGLFIYPNPTNGIITINCSSTETKSACILSVKNTLGQIIYNEAIKEYGSFTKQIDLSTSPKGIYYLELQYNHSNSSQKENRREVKKIVLQ